MHTFKRLLPLTLAAAILFSAVGIGSHAKAAGVTLQLWHGWQGTYADAITKVFDDYNKTNKDGITVELSNPGDLNKSLDVAIPAGQGPDIIAWADDVIGKNVLAGNIISLDELGVTQDFLKKTYEPAAIAGVTYNGKIWGLPEAQEGISLICNSALVKPEDFPKDPKDFNGLLDLATKFRKANADKYLIYNQGLGNSDAYHASPIYYGFGAYYVKEDGSVGINTKEAQAAADWIVKFSAVAPKEISDELMRAAFTGGKAACAWTGPWALADFKKAGIKYFIQPFGSPFVGIKVELITVNAKDRKTDAAALKVLQFFNTAEVQAALSKANSTIPAASAALKDPDVANNPDVVGFGKQFALGVPQPNTPFMDFLWGPVGDATTAIFNGSQKPAEALAAAEQAALEKIKDAKSKMATPAK